MTLPPHRIGDKGQRYVYRATGWGEDETEEVNVIYADKIDDADSVLSALLARPGATRAALYDRKKGVAIITRYGGVLR